MISTKHAAVGTAIVLFSGLLLASPISAFYASIDFEQREFAREEQNLAAQWGIQTANEAMVRLTGIQIALSIVTTIGLFLTLRMSRKALEQADRTLAQSREIAAIELRSYVAIEQIKVTAESGRTYKCEAVVINRGSTPATNVEIQAQLGFAATSIFDDIEWPKDDLETDVGHQVSLQPGGQAGPIRYTNLTASQLSLLNHDLGCLYWAAIVKYDDVFGVRHARRVGMAFRGAKLLPSPVPGQNTEHEIAQA